MHFLREHVSRISRWSSSASRNVWDLPDDVPIRADGRCTVHLLCFHDVFQLSSHLPGLTKQFRVQEMLHTPVVSESARPNRKKIRSAIRIQLASVRGDSPMTLPLLVDMQQGKMIALGDEKLFTCRVTLLLSLLWPIKD